jgi:hypothetical protein
MSLITMGLGHLTITTFGLGNGMVVGETQVLGEPFGEVTFIDKPVGRQRERIDFKDNAPKIRVKEDNPDINIDKESPDIEFKRFRRR